MGNPCYKNEAIVTFILLSFINKAQSRGLQKVLKEEIKMKLLHIFIYYY